MKNITFALLTLGLTLGVVLAAESPTDIVVYGGTPAGVTAAIQAARMGRSVILIEPGAHIGGLTSSGLGATDIGNKQAIGGLAREFYQRVHRYYARPEAWTHGTLEEYRRQSPGRVDDDTMWGFEPHVAEAIFRSMLADAHVNLVERERLDLQHGVRKDGSRITAIVMESGRVFPGRMFIDATYEGDLMAKAGVSYTIGREATARYGETLNGVQTRHAIEHQFMKPVDPYVKPGDPASGLLPGIHAGGPGEEGDGDARVQAYNFRMCLTDLAENRVPYAKPAHYAPLRYELMLRHVEAGFNQFTTGPQHMPNRKSDVNNHGACSTDNIGMNYDYPEGDYAARDRIVADHRDYQLGLMWTLANDPRMPKGLREKYAAWGLAKDEFVGTGHWPHQLYIREARRMVSGYVMTEHNCRGTTKAEDAVGLGAYGMDSHNVQRYVDSEGHARNEGDVQVRVPSPYPIAYRSIIPQAPECENLLVPVCLAATHIAYGSIRMEPVFMVLGQSAATAAALALDTQVPLQKLDCKKLHARLLADKQILEWSGANQIQALPAIPLPSGVIVDDQQAQRTGGWSESRNQAWSRAGLGYLHDDNTNKGHASLTFTPEIPADGNCEIFLIFPPHPNRATRVPVTVAVQGGVAKTVMVNQRDPNTQGRVSLGKFFLPKGRLTSVTVSNRDTDGYVVADAVRFLPVE